MREAWPALLDSFTLTTPRGSRFALTPTPATMEEGSPPTPTATEESPAPAKAAETATKPARVDFASFALADSDASLNDDHPVNANLRNRGAGLVPNVVATDDMEKFAIVAAGSIRAQFRVPFGWHVIDDGRRVLIFEPRNEIQINLHLLAREGRNNQAVLDDLEAEARASYPTPEFMRMREGQIEVLGVRGIADGDQTLEQYHMLHPTRQKHLVLRARVTTVPSRNADGLNLAELMLKSMDFGAMPDPEDPAPPQDAAKSEKARRKALVRALQANGSVDTAMEERFKAAAAAASSAEAPGRSMSADPEP